MERVDSQGLRVATNGNGKHDAESLSGGSVVVAAPAQTMRVSVIIPVYNEENHVEQVIRDVDAIDLDKEIIVVDDCSTDASLTVLQQLTHSNLRVVCHEVNQGKGAAIRTGIEYATGEIILIQDCDTEYDPGDYYELVRPIQEGRAQVVYGSRFKGRIANMAYPNWLANKILTTAANLLYGTNITDEATCCKVFKADLLKQQPLKCKRFEFCPEVTALLGRQAVPIVEVPISYKGRSVAEGKKISARDGFVALWTLVKYRVGR
jgi:cellulose synthase/poly-beta-1,6-N-acetylglucosamine synthase-like glycosyltransferase